MENLQTPYIAQIGIGRWGKNVCRDLNKIGVLKTISIEEGSIFIEVKVSKGSRKDLGRPTSKPFENKEIIMKYISQNA